MGLNGFLSTETGSFLLSSISLAIIRISHEVDDGVSDISFLFFLPYRARRRISTLITASVLMAVHEVILVVEHDIPIDTTDMDNH